MKCPVSKLCGGCSLLNIAYEKQGMRKQEEIQDLVRQSGLAIKVMPVHMAQNAIGYRNKVIYGFAKDKDKKIYSGLYAPKSHKVINTKNCPMQPDLVNQILEEITHLVNSMKIELYQPRTGSGILRHVLIRYAKETDQVMVVFVTATRDFPSRRNLVNALRQKFPQIRTILQNINPRDTSIVLQDETIVLYGNGMITDKLCGLNISFTASAFYQINHDQCEVLYNLAGKMLDLSKKDEVLDTYCGVGTIGLTLAEKCRTVTGVEINKDAVENARYNAKQNSISNIRFLAMDSTRFMQEAARNHKTYDAIILDPPRAGTTKEFVESACRLHPQKILYISCNPVTQLRDLKWFKQNGYMCSKMELVDMFPNTEHIETVAVLSRKSASKSFIPVSISPKDMGLSEEKEQPTYANIRDYVQKTHGMKVSSLYVAQMKAECGLETQADRSGDKKQPKCPPEKREAILDAFRHFGLIGEDGTEE